jgi:hypothetical protein
MVMKLEMTNNRVLMAILVIASVGGTFAVAQGFDLFNYNSQTPFATGGALLTGNVKVIQYDEDGNIVAYRQTDNHIVKEGMEIIMAQVFRDINTTINYPNPTVGLPRPVEFMQIGTGGEYRLLHNNTDIFSPIAGCVRQTTTISNTTAQGAHKYPGACTDAVGNLCSAQMNVTAVSSFLGSASCNVNSIDEAGIFDNSTSTTVGMDGGGAGNGGGYMFARNTFGSVNLGALDTLQLQWEFTFTDS